MWIASLLLIVVYINKAMSLTVPQQSLLRKNEKLHPQPWFNLEVFNIYLNHLADHLGYETFNSNDNMEAIHESSMSQQPISNYTDIIDQLEEYAQIAGLDDNLQLPPLFNIPPDSVIPTEVCREIDARLAVFDLTETADCIMREFIGPILIGAIRLMGPHSEFKIKSDHKIAGGARGLGPIDYDISFHLFHVIMVTEPKNGKDVFDGIPENAVQLVASREVLQNAFRKKRKHEKHLHEHELRDEIDNKLRTFGIVSSGRSWVFICYYKNSDGDWKLERSVEYHLPLSSRPTERVLLQNGVTEVLAIVAGIMSAQKLAIENFESTLVDSAKRSKLTGTEG